MLGLPLHLCALLIQNFIYLASPHNNCLGIQHENLLFIFQLSGILTQFVCVCVCLSACEWMCASCARYCLCLCSEFCVLYLWPIWIDTLMTAHSGRCFCLKRAICRCSHLFPGNLNCFIYLICIQYLTFLGQTKQRRKINKPL